MKIVRRKEMAALKQDLIDKYGGKDGFMSYLWGFIKKYGTPEESDEYWLNVVEESEQINEKFDHDEMVLSLLVTVVKVLEFQSKHWGRDDIVLKVVNVNRHIRGLLPVKEVKIE